MTRRLSFLLPLLLAACGGGSAGSWDAGDWRHRIDVDPNAQYASVSFDASMVPDGVSTPNGLAGLWNLTPNVILSVEYRDANGQIAVFPTAILPTQAWESPLALVDGMYLLVARTANWTYARWFRMADGFEAPEVDNGEIFIP